MLNVDVIHEVTEVLMFLVLIARICNSTVSDRMDLTAVLYFQIFCAFILRMK